MKRKCFRFTFAALVCTVLLGITGCGKKDPYTAYKEASQKTSDLDSLDAAADITMTMSASGQNFDISMHSDMKLSGINTEAPLADIAITIDMLGQSMTMSTYYTDGYYYAQNGDSKLKYAMEPAILKSEISASSMQTDLKKDDFKEISLEKKEADNLITFILYGDSMNDMVNSTLGTLGGILDSSEISMQIDDVSGTASINKDGYFTNMAMQLPIAMTMSGQDISLDMGINVAYTDPGEDILVELPDDLDEYEYIDTSDPGEAYDTFTDDSSDENESTEDANAEDAAIIGGAEGSTDIEITDAATADTQDDDTPAAAEDAFTDGSLS